MIPGISPNPNHNWSLKRSGLGSKEEIDAYIEREQRNQAQKRLEAEQRRIETKEKEAREMIMPPARAMALRQVILRCMSQRAGAIRDREEHAAQKKHKKKAKFELQKASSLRARRAAYERISSPKAAEASYVTDGDRTEVIVETMEEQSRKANAAARRAKDKVAKLAVRRPRKESV